jgi:MFS family permease
MVGASPSGSGVWDEQHRRLTMGLALTISITAFEAMAVATVLPAVAEQLGGGQVGWYGWVFSGFMLANLVGIPAAGLLSDRAGAASPFVAGSALFAFGLVLSGLAGSMPWLVAGRVVQGLGAGALSSVAYAAVARSYDAASQPRVLALLASAWVVPGLLGPVAAAGLEAALGWRSVFLALVPLTVVAAVLAATGLGHPPPSSSESPRSMRPALQLAAGSALAMLAMQAADVASSVVLAAAGAALALPALHGLLPPGTLTARPGAPAALASKALVTIAFFGTEAFLPLALTSVCGESIAAAGVALTAGTLAWTGGAWVQERLARRVARTRLLRAGLALVAAAVLGQAAMLASPHPLALAVVSWGAAGLGIGIAYQATTLAVFEHTPKGSEGGAGASLQLVNVLGIALGAGLGGALLALADAAGWSRAAGIAAVDVAMALAVAAALAVSLRVPDEGAAPLGS